MTNADENYPAEAFALLDECAKANLPIDVSSAISLSLEIPPKVEKAVIESEYGRTSGGMGDRGDIETLEKCAEYFKRSGIACTADNIALSLDIFEGIREIYPTLFKKYGKSVLVIAPIFGYLVEQLRNIKSDYHILRSAKPDFLVDPQLLEEAIKETGAKIVIIAPSNPTGTPITQENAKQIARVVKLNDAFCIIDAAFHPTNWDDPTMHLSSMLGTEYSLTITSLPKAMFATRVSFCAGPQELVKRCLTSYGGYQEQDQKMIIAALEDNEENRQFFEKNKRIFTETVAVFNQRIRDLNRIFCQIFGEPKSGEDYVKPYVENPRVGVVGMIDFSGLRGKVYRGKKLDTGLDIAKWLAECAGVSTVPAECFYIDEKEMAIRVAFGCSRKDLEITPTPMAKMTRMFDSINQAAKEITNEPRTATENRDSSRLSFYQRSRL